MRIGQGYDVHRLSEGRKLVLGGVDVPFHLGLQGHSDADVLIHAIIDALLGAAKMGDIGRLFPDTDPQYKGVDSTLLLKNVGFRLKCDGYFIANIDATIIAQKPKLAAYIPQMEANIADCLGCDIDQINIKATTGENMGFVGRQEGMAAQAICLIQKL